MTEAAPGFDAEDAKGDPKPQISNQQRAILRRRTIMRRASIAGALFLLGVLAVAVPEALLARGTEQAQECFTKYAEPRSPEAPACRSAISLLRVPARFPWTANRAQFRIEEIGVRNAYFEYVDAAVGKPHREALTLAAEAIEHQATVVQNGTRRLAMKELGPSVGAPDLGRTADELGDRHTLLERGEQWFNWRVRLSTLRAALLAGDIEKTKALAKRYAVDDPRDPDIRSAVAALLCMGPDPAKGAEMLAFIQDDRAARPYEGMSRDYGEVRAMLMACLAKRDLPPPPLPTSTKAGSADAVEQRALLRLRHADTPASEVSRPTAIATVVRFLEGGPRNPGARLALLAALLGTGTNHDPETIVRYSKPKFDETPIAPPITLTALEWVTDHRPAPGDTEPAAILPGSAYLVAARTVEALEAKLADAKDKPKVQGDEKPNEDTERLRGDLVSLRGALLLEATASLARDGNVEDAVQAADDATRILKLPYPVRDLLRSNVYWVNGDRLRAFQWINGYFERIFETSPAIIFEDKRFNAALSVQRSELAMSLGKTDVARQVAHDAATFATAANDPALFARARWMLAALGEPNVPPPAIVDLSTPRPFPPMGFADPSEPWSKVDQDKQRALVEQALAPWIGLATADAPLRRAGRWAAMQSRGDAPPWLSVHLLLASHLLQPTEGDVEVWLDALMGMDHRRFSLRSYAFARAEAARMRGDMATATAWDERYRTLQKLAAEVPHYEFTRHLDI